MHLPPNALDQTDTAMAQAQNETKPLVLDYIAGLKNRNMLVIQPIIWW